VIAFSARQKQLLWEACLDWIDAYEERIPSKKAKLEQQFSFRLEQLKQALPPAVDVDKTVETLALELHALQQNIRENVRQSTLAAAQARYVAFVTSSFTQTSQKAELEARRIALEVLDES